VSRSDEAPEGHRHRFDPAALFAGLLFVSVAVWFGAAALAGYRVLIAAALPTLLIGFAVIGFVRVATRSRRR
jgi:hypothetical protein